VFVDLLDLGRLVDLLLNLGIVGYYLGAAVDNMCALALLLNHWKVLHYLCVFSEKHLDILTFLFRLLHALFAADRTATTRVIVRTNNIPIRVIVII